MVLSNLLQLALAPPGLLLFACAGTGEDLSPAPLVDQNSQVVATSEPVRREQLIQAVELEQYEQAHELLEAILHDRYLLQASKFLEVTPPIPQDAMLWLDRAVSVGPRSPEAMIMRGDCSLLLAQNAIQSGGGFAEGFLQDARDSFSAAKRFAAADPRAWLGASRTEYMMFSFEAALANAQKAMELIGEGPAPDGLREAPVRTLAKAAYQAYASTKESTQSEAAPLVEGERQTELFASALDALGRVLAEDPLDPWGYETLANLYLWQGNSPDAISALQRGLDKLPRNSALLEMLANTARNAGGLEQARAAVSEFTNKHPEVAEGAWWLGRETFQSAVADLGAGGKSEEDFVAAERLFARSRELSAELESSAKGYEVMARNGAGWIQFNRGDLEAASASFLSMNEVFERGIEWSIEGQLPSGIQGLNFVADKYHSMQQFEAAADVYQILAELQPENVAWTNNVGFLNRDAAVQLEERARVLCSAVADLEGESPKELSEAVRQRLLDMAGLDENFEGDLPAALRSAADQLLSHAKALMDLSAEAYLRATTLAPEDVRIINDAALIIVYYTYSDFELAQKLLEQSIALGAEQLADEDLSEDARWELENAWGDAHQNMGFLHLVNLNDPQAARPWFERCVEIGPDPRPFVTAVLLPLCDHDPTQPAPGNLLRLRSWGAGCP